MPVAVQLDRLSLSEKLALLEDLWDDLRRTPASVASPEWHRELLAEREQAVREGRVTFRSLDQARKRIDKATE